LAPTVIYVHKSSENMVGNEDKKKKESCNRKKDYIFIIFSPLATIVGCLLLLFFILPFSSYPNKTRAMEMLLWMLFTYHVVFFFVFIFVIFSF
jgi:hypothetical protein